MLSVPVQALAHFESSFASLPSTRVQIVLFMYRPQEHPHTMPPIWKVRLEQLLFHLPRDLKNALSFNRIFAIQQPVKFLAEEGEAKS